MEFVLGLTIRLRKDTVGSTSTRPTRSNRLCAISDDWLRFPQSELFSSIWPAVPPLDIDQGSAMQGRLRLAYSGSTATDASLVSIRNVSVSCRYRRTTLSVWLR